MKFELLLEVNQDKSHVEILKTRLDSEKDKISEYKEISDNY